MRVLSRILPVVVACASLVALAQQNTAKLVIKAALFDRDLNLSPVPKTIFVLTSLSDKASPTQTFQITTSFEGVGEIDLPPSEYRLTSLKPVEFKGKTYSWDMKIAVVAPETRLEISNNNATITESVRNLAIDDATAVFKRYRDSVVTVWAEVGAGHGTGFIIDPAGLIVTNQHVTTTSEYIAVQFDDTHLLPAVVLAEDATKDVAVLWVNLEKVPEAIPAPLLKKGAVPAEEGEKVFTIGSPLHQRKIMTTGIVSKVEPRAIISDININPGNSGGPLFNSNGDVIGITTFLEQRRYGPGISGIVRIEEAFPLVEQAKVKMSNMTKPSSVLLPSSPTDVYPIEAIRANLMVEKFKVDPYIFKVGDYDVAVITPILKYRQLARDVKAGKEKEKRNRKSAAAVQGSFRPLDELKGWAEYVGEYEPVLLIQASPRLKEGFWSAMGRGMAASRGYVTPAKLRFRTDFYKMKLLCGSQEIKPLFPGKMERVIDERNAFVNVTDATFDGLYKYSADAITSKCGQVTLQISSEKDPNQPKVKILDQKTINVVAADFKPYLEAREKTEIEHADQSVPHTEKQATQVSETGTLTVVSNPAGGEVFIDSVQSGRSPMTIHLSPGQHSVQVALQGYVDWAKAVFVTAGKETSIRAELPKKD